MKIREVVTHLLSYPYPKDVRYGWSGGDINKWDSLLVEVVTDEGTSGLGEAGCAIFDAELMANMVPHFANLIVGEDPLKVQRLWKKMYDASLFWNRRGIGMGIISAIDMALWDLAGKTYGVPCYALLGGLTKDRVKAYASGGVNPSLEVTIKAVKEYVRKGFRGVKVRLFEPKEAGERVGAIRSAVGPDIDLMVDAVQGANANPLTGKDALQVAQAIEPHKPFWFEEPCGAEDIDGYAFVRSHSSLKIAGVESATSRYSFAELVRRGAVDVLQPDASIVGGMTEAWRIFALAECTNKEVAPHSWGTSVSMAANLHLVLSSIAGIRLEFVQAPNPFIEAFFVEKLNFREGYIHAPKSPGLGVRLDEKLMAKYPYIKGPGHVMKT